MLFLCKSLEIVMRILSAVLFLAFASEALAECGNLCDRDWWIKWPYKTLADLQSELDAGASTSAFDKDGGTALHHAAYRDGHIDFAGNSTDTIQTLLNADGNL